MGTWAEIMREIPDEQLVEASSTFQTVDFAAGETLITQGTEDPVMLYLMSGRVEILRDEMVVETVGEGAVLGGMSMIRQRPQIAGARAVSPTRGLFLDKDGYDKLVAEANPVIFRFERLAVEQMAARLRNLNTLVRERADGEADRYARPGKGFFAKIRALVGDSTVAPKARTLDPVDVLKKSPIFEGELPEVLEALGKVWEPVVYGTGASLCEQGDAADGLYLVGLGAADVYVALPGRKIHKLGSVGPGDAVGMTAMLDGKPRGATVIATEQVDALRLSKSAFDDLMSEESARASGLRRAVMRGFADQVNEAGQGVVDVTPPPQPPEEGEEGVEVDSRMRDGIAYY